MCDDLKEYTNSLSGVFVVSSSKGVWRSFLMSEFLMFCDRVFITVIAWIVELVIGVYDVATCLIHR